MKKKRKLKKQFILIILLLGIFVTYQVFAKNNSNDKTVMNDILKKNNIDKKYYSKTLEYVLLNNIYNEEYLEEYKDIEFNNEENFATILTTFLPKGYKGKEINYLLKLSTKNIENLKNIDYQNIEQYYNIKNFDASKLERYKNYSQKHQDLKIEDIITQTNLNLDLNPYTETKEVADANDHLVLVNKYNYLPKGYQPSDIVYLDGAYKNQVPVRKVLQESFLKLQESAKKELNINLMPTTAFRGEGFQRTLYNNYVAKDGITAADTYSARPSYSEHQTGLAIDLRNTALSSNIRLTDDNYTWLENNAYKYGFIIRFPKNKEHITLYQFENWHIRYVGDKAAKIIHDNNLTLEEYIDLYVTSY